MYSSYGVFLNPCFKIMMGIDRLRSCLVIRIPYLPSLLFCYKSDRIGFFLSASNFVMLMYLKTDLIVVVLLTVDGHYTTFSRLNLFLFRLYRIGFSRTNYATFTHLNMINLKNVC